MFSVSVRELADTTSRVVREVSETGQPRIITNRGVPVAAIVPINQAELENLILSSLPDFVSSMESANEELAEGTTQSVEALRDEARKT